MEVQRADPGALHQALERPPRQAVERRGEPEHRVEMAKGVGPEPVPGRELAGLHRGVESSGGLELGEARHVGLDRHRAGGGDGPAYRVCRAPIARVVRKKRHSFSGLQRASADDHLRDPVPVDCLAPSRTDPKAGEPDDYEKESPAESANRHVRSSSEVSALRGVCRT